MSDLRAISLFAGVGGIDKGFHRVGFTTVWANEFDKYAAEVFQANFNCPLVVRDIQSVDISEIPEFDILLAGFPCQSFSIAGYQKGFEDSRGNLYFDIIRILEARKPKVVFLENVKNLVNHDGATPLK